MKTFLMLISLSAFTYGAALSIDEILPTRLMSGQCKDVCICGRYDYCPSPDTQYEMRDCVTGTRKSNCCDFCAY